MRMLITRHGIAYEVPLPINSSTGESWLDVPNTAAAIQLSSTDFYLCTILYFCQTHLSSHFVDQTLEEGNQYAFAYRNPYYLLALDHLEENGWAIKVSKRTRKNTTGIHFIHEYHNLPKRETKLGQAYKLLAYIHILPSPQEDV